MKLIEEVGRFCVSTASAELTQEKLLDSFKKKIVEMRMETIEDCKIEVQLLVVFFSISLKKIINVQMSTVAKYLIDSISQLKIKFSFLMAHNFNNLRDDFHNKYFLQTIGPAKWDVYDEKKKVIETDKAMFQRLA